MLSALWLCAAAASISVSIDENPKGTQFTDALKKALEADGWQSADPADVLVHGSVEVHGSDAVGSLKATERATKAIVAVVPFAEQKLDAAVKAVVTALHGAQKAATPAGNDFTVRLKGCTFGDITDVEQALAKAPGVISAHATADFENEQQDYVVSFKGDAKQLARVISALSVGKKKLAGNAQGNVVNAAFRKVKLELFHAISEAGSARVRRWVDANDKLGELRYRNVFYPEVVQDLLAHGGSVEKLPALWDGTQLHVGADAVIARISR